VWRWCQVYAPAALSCWKVNTLHTSGDINPTLDQHCMYLAVPTKVRFVSFPVHPLRKTRFLLKLFLRGKQFFLIWVVPF
jgi:hypothetical protein